MPTKDCVVETAGELLGNGCAVELIRHGGELGLLLWDGKRATQAAEVEHRGRRYRPVNLETSIARALRLPTRTAPFGSTRELFTDVSALLVRHGVAEGTAPVLTHFSFSTWFVDCLQTAPCLWIPAAHVTEAASLVRLLACLCRRSFLLADLNRAALQMLPMGLQPTLLIYQQRLAPSVQHLLWAARTRGIAVPVKAGLLDLFGARAVCTAHLLPGFLAEGTLQVPLTPRAGLGGALDEETIEKIADEFQAKLLAYRLANYQEVRRSTFDVTEFTGPMRSLARSLGNCIVDAPEIQSAIIPLLKDRDEAVRAERATSREAVVLEAVLFHCHERDRGAVYVGEVAKATNAILSGRGEVLQLEDRAVGATLNSLGLCTGRLNGKGRGLLLSRTVRLKAHALGQEYDVPLVEEKVANCADCAEGRRGSPRSQGGQ